MLDTLSAPLVGSQLLALPAELRNTIWEYALPCSNEYLVYNHHGVRSSPGLISASRQVRTETRLMYYARSSFTLVEPWCSGHSNCFEVLFNWLQSIGSDACAVSTTVRIQTSLENTPSSWKKDEPLEGRSHYLTRIAWEPSTCSFSISTLQLQWRERAFIFNKADLLAWPGKMYEAGRLAREQGLGSEDLLYFAKHAHAAAKRGADINQDWLSRAMRDQMLDDLQPSLVALFILIMFALGISDRMGRV